MTCLEARGLIHGMLDLELSSNEQSSLETHLTGCPECRNYAGLFGRLKERLAALAAHGAATGSRGRLDVFMESLEPVVANRGMSATGSKPRFVWATAAAVLVAVGIFAGMALLAPSSTLAESTIEQHRLWGTGQLVLDAHASCCRQLQEWFQTQVKHPVDVPDITYDGLEVQGAKLYYHATEHKMFYIASHLHEEPVSLFILSGRDIHMPKGSPCSCDKPDATATVGPDYTMISWRSGENILVLVTSFDLATTEAICAGIR